jgi:hypothetical protein
VSHVRRLVGTLALAGVALSAAGPLAAQARGVAAGSTVPLPSGKLAIKVRDGSLQVIAAERRDVLIHTERDSSRGGGIGIAVSGSGQSGRTLIDARSNGRADYRMVVPIGTEVDISAEDAEVEIRGGVSASSAAVQHGRVTIDGARGPLAATIGTGSVTIRNSGGPVSASAMNGDIILSHVTGVTIANNSGGPIHLDDVLGSSVQAMSIGGEVVYEGRIQDGGTYFLRSHAGRVRLAAAPGSNATVNWKSVKGDLRGSRSGTETLGRGSATITIETFSGAIEIVGAGKAR